MSLAFAALRQLTGQAAALRQPAALPTRSLCRQQAEMPQPPPPPPAVMPDADLDALRQELWRVCTGSGAPGQRLALLRRAPAVLWRGPVQAAGFPGLLDTVLHMAATRPDWLRLLIEAWLRDFGPGRIALLDVGREIGALLAETAHPALRFWREAEQRDGLFDAEEAPRRLARTLLHGPDDVAEVLARTGLDDRRRADGGFFRAVIAAMLADVPAVLSGPEPEPAWRRAAAVLTGAAGIAESPDAIVRACLDPWLKDAPPPVSLRTDVVDALVLGLGDPRFAPDRWATVHPDLTQRVRAWLAEASLEAFLVIVGDSGDEAQGRERAAFWRACLRAMPAADVWVVLGNGLRRPGAFGRMVGGGAANATQAVLLLRLGDIVLSEASGSGPVRAWDVGDPACPALYRREPYTVEELRAPGLDFPRHPVRGGGGSVGGKGMAHRNGAGGLWQGCVAALLASAMPFNLGPDDYLP